MGSPERLDGKEKVTATPFDALEQKIHHPHDHEQGYGYEKLADAPAATSAESDDPKHPLGFAEYPKHISVKSKNEDGEIVEGTQVVDSKEEEKVVRQAEAKLLKGAAPPPVVPSSAAPPPSPATT